MSDLDYYRSHPPRCLAAFTSHPLALTVTEPDGHGEEANTAFRLACGCGAGSHRILGHFWRNEYYKVVVFVGPLALSCESCGKVAELLDTEHHGYDGEICGGGATARGEGERAEFHCEGCGGGVFEAYVRFEYPDDLMEMFNEGIEDFIGGPEDLFTWFWLAGRCEGCGTLGAITDFECA
jgi:hypothetical protein